MITLTHLNTDVEIEAAFETQKDCENAGIKIEISNFEMKAPENIPIGIIFDIGKQYAINLITKKN